MTVALVGSIVTVCEGAGVAIDAGDPVADDDNALGGCVKTAVTTATGYRIGLASTTSSRTAPARSWSSRRSSPRP